MSDVLKRLRSIQNDCAQYVAGSDIMREAADEIERQQQRIRELEAALRGMLTFYGMDRQKGEVSDMVHRVAEEALEQTDV